MTEQQGFFNPALAVLSFQC